MASGYITGSSAISRRAMKISRRAMKISGERDLALRLVDTRVPAPASPGGGGVATALAP
jgi:hypothetical protein